MSLSLQPITIREASAFVDRHHRHHNAPQGGLFAVAVNDGDRVVGAAIVGRPVSRHIQAGGYCAEVTRVCVLDGVKNGCSMLYGACWRAARALGWRRLITYTLKSESGTSLRGAGWVCIGEAGGGNWNKKSRPRVDTPAELQQVKFRWEMSI